MKKFALMILLFVYLIIASGCATIFTDDSQNITFDSEPEGARIKIGPYTGITPCALLIPKGKNFAIEASYGAKKQVQPLTTKMAGSTLINILFWPGFIVDAMTGNIKKYDPDHYTFNFSEPVAAKTEEKRFEMQ